MYTPDVSLSKALAKKGVYLHNSCWLISFWHSSWYLSFFFFLFLQMSVVGLVSVGDFGKFSSFLNTLFMRQFLWVILKVLNFTFYNRVLLWYRSLEVYPWCLLLSLSFYFCWKDLYVLIQCTILGFVYFFIARLRMQWLELTGKCYLSFEQTTNSKFLPHKP